MSNPRPKAILLVPFWRQTGHVGRNRVDRVVRWLADGGYDIVLVGAGRTESVRDTSWGVELTVRDPLGLYRDPEPGTDPALPRRATKLQRTVAHRLFSPDPSVVWARAAARHPAVLEAARGGTCILSSSPPESIHLGAWLLSKRTSVPHIVDLRDGWLDEPLRALLRTSGLRRWQERRMEARILRDATAILVTSGSWKELLCRRLPELAAKVHVITNAYPHTMPEARPAPPITSERELVLIHAGRFTDSRWTQHPGLLLSALLHNLSQEPARGVVRLIGALPAEDLRLIERFRPDFAAAGWRIECPGSVPREALLALLPQADGLLLLSASHAAIPSKLFEYIPTGRPIFVVTERGSATWQICERLAQAILVDLAEANPSAPSEPPFYRRSGADMPQALTEAALAERFRDVLREFRGQSALPGGTVVMRRP